MATKHRNSIIAISLGDPAGVSPEVVTASLPSILDRCRPILFGHWPSIEKSLKRSSSGLEIELIDSPVPPDKGKVTVVHCGPKEGPIEKPGIDAANAQFEALSRAVDYCLSSDCKTLVTGPIAKELVAKVCPGFTGHTEYLAQRAGLKSDDVTMVFASKELSVGLVSTHVPIRDAADALTMPRIERTVRHLKMLISKMSTNTFPRIGVAALNPHAGENGLLGKEEEEVLRPICTKLAKSKDFDLKGPIPADTLFREARLGKYDGIVSAYHDQAMIPLKLMGVGKTVNVTMGLPFIRTSPDHGVAYDIAGKGLADPRGMELAMDMAAILEKGGR